MTSVTMSDQLQQAAALVDAGRFGDAEQIVRQVLSTQPNTPTALNLLGVIASRTGHLEPAAELIQRALTLAPDNAEFQFNLGGVLLALRRFHAAETCFSAVTRRHPNERAAWNNLGGALVAMGRNEEAAQCFSRAIALAPRSSQYHSNLAKALEVTGQVDAAERSARKAVELSAQGASEHAVLASVLVTRGRLSEGIAAYRRALELAPEMNLARFNLANALRSRGQIDESIATYRDALAREPQRASGHSALLLTLHCSDVITPQALSDEHRAWAARHAEPLRSEIRPHDNDRSPDRRLRIGYVSPDFREHAVACFIEPALALDPAQFEVFCYVEEFRADRVTHRLKSIAPNWRNTVSLSDVELADQIRADRIDILVDLAGHTADNRLLVFARKPAPVQATYLGYPNTTGMSAMDWRITDALADPVGMTEALHTERLIRPSGCAWCYRPPDDAPESHRDRRPGDVITFASFNALGKVSNEAIALWSRILAAVPNSRLLIKAPAFEDRDFSQRYRDGLARHGIPADRLELLPATPSIADHLALFSKVDIALDTMPYNGTTTTCEALWMGVPVITLAGRSHVGRVGTSLLTHADLGELVAQTAEQYVDLAVQLACDERSRSDWRQALRAKLRASDLMNAERAARDLADAYRVIWRDWCATR